MRGLYVHIPFCVKKCRYCDFYSLPVSPEIPESYIKALLKEAGHYAGMSFTTMYIGGGTPSLLGGERVSELVSGLRQILDLTGLEESTIEVNPESASGEFFDAVRSAGINRVSIGVQSLNDKELKAVGRIHTASRAVGTVDLAKKTGFDSVSADLIIGLPGQTWLTLNKSLDTLVHTGPEHISLYCLSLEEGTPLYENPPRDLPSDDMQAELFQYAVAFLKRHSYGHYEISNFALEGFESRHNLNYWRGGEYLGLGPAAASHLDGKRFRNRACLDEYLVSPTGQVEDIEELGVREKAAEEAVLRLRLLEEGLSIDWLAEKYGRNNIRELADRCESLAGQGQLTAEGPVYRLAPSMVLTSNKVFSELV
ncbi:MAG: radical SAM family heme chaperone HemW [Dehalococcoidales bacterium]|nr:radical SAM family heme chaperone HemW [Dehalococcoidales bacterium]